MRIPSLLRACSDAGINPLREMVAGLAVFTMLAIALTGLAVIGE